MEEIMKQIIKIDSIAYEKKKQSEERMKEKQMRYEDQIGRYEKEKMEQAAQTSEEIYNKITSLGKKEYHIAQEKVKQEVLEIEKKYMQIEAQLLEELLEKIVALEA